MTDQAENPAERANRLATRMQAAGISDEVSNAKIAELGGDVLAAANYFENLLNQRDAEKQDRESAFAAFGAKPPEVAAVAEETSHINYIRDLNSTDIDIEIERKNDGDTPSEKRKELEAKRDGLVRELESMVTTEKEKERYLDASLRLFTRLQVQKEAVLDSLKAFKGLTPNRNELMNQLNSFVDKIEGLRKEGDVGTPERREAELKAAALEFELRKAREEVLVAIENYNPIGPLWLAVLREFELAEDQKISRENTQIRRLLEILDVPNLRIRYGEDVYKYQEKFNALARIHNFAVAGNGKGAVEITAALGELDQAALVELFQAEELRKDIIDAYIRDRIVFDDLNLAGMAQKQAEARLEEETVLGNNKRTFKREVLVDPNDPTKVTYTDELETLYHTTSSDAEKKALIAANQTRLTEGYKLKKAWETKYVDDVLADEFFSTDMIASFRTTEGVAPTVTEAEVKKMIEASYKYNSRKIILAQEMDNMIGFLETTVAPMVVEPIRVKTTETLKNKRTEGYIFAGKYKDNILVKTRYPQDVLEAGGKINSRVLDITSPIFDKGFYKYCDPESNMYSDPGYKLMMETFGMEKPTDPVKANDVIDWLERFKTVDALRQIRNNPEVVNKLKDDVYKDAATAQASEMYDKFEAFQKEPNEESAKALMASYFSKTPEDRRNFNMQVIEALLNYKRKINNIYAFEDFSERKNWGARRIEDYIRKAREAGLIGLREENELKRRVFKGKEVRLGKLKIATIPTLGKKAEMVSAWTKEVFGPKNLKDTAFSWVKTLFKVSADQIKSDLK